MDRHIDGLEDYILAHIDPEPELLHEVWRQTQLRLAYGQMACGHLQGRLLRMLVALTRPRRILEIGTFSGYSALAMAEGMGPEAELHTIEAQDELEPFLREQFARSPWESRIRLHIGDARHIVERLDEKWDFVFIDADKRQYTDYYRLVIPRMREGGLLLADDTLWYGRIQEQPRESDLQLRGLQEFNDCVARDTRVEKVILPLRDGLTLIRKKDITWKQPDRTR